MASHIGCNRLMFKCIAMDNQETNNGIKVRNNAFSYKFEFCKLYILTVLLICKLYLRLNLLFLD